MGEPWNVFNNHASLNAGTDCFPKESGYEIGDYFIIIKKNHPFYGEAAKVIGRQTNIFDPNKVDALHGKIIEPNNQIDWKEVVISPEGVRKLNDRST